MWMQIACLVGLMASTGLVLWWFSTPTRSPRSWNDFTVGGRMVRGVIGVTMWWCYVEAWLWLARGAMGIL